ncbi:hypothetical protein PPERSA_02698 [Pseudocohnilembus persalinus]|uniref:Uncharacterized protein n=1 Tax=Pseudocohnilembus persalinus TaxID=266149 RepID=A0A0V0R5P9_PSEPJ|nr:hypothetical protein PPERSA_02698 [Pseudocohnilembus persalinus]|eukprot:KRX09826.1 hypothetical protein PPERSA_02698 [Pseudocohnilembus persalinus]
MSIVKNGDYYEIVIDNDQKDLQQTQLGKTDSESQNQNADYMDTTPVNPQQSFNKLYQQQQIISVSNSGRGGAQQVIVETPMEKLNRIKLEIQEFKEQMQFMNEKSQEQLNKEEQLDILQEIEILQKELANVASVSEFQKFFQVDKNQFKLENNIAVLKQELQEKVTQNLIKKIDQLKQQEQNPSGGQQQQSQKNKVEIFLDLEKSKLQEQSKFLELEKRIALLENALGKEEIGKINKNGTNKNPENSLLYKSEYLSNLVESFDNNQIKEYQEKLEKIVTDIEQIKNDKNLQGTSNNISPQELKKIQELYEKVNNIQGISDELPLLVDRLESLRFVHEESAGFMLNLSSLSELHNKVISQLGTNDQLLNKLQGNFTQNLGTIQNNVQNLEQRIQNLEKK